MKNYPLLLVVCLFLSIKGFAQTNPRPNILWIISENMSQDQACYGNKRVKTLDELDKNKPFFAKVNSFYTHRIFKKDTINPIDSADVKLPKGFEPGTVSDQLLASIEMSATTLALAGIKKPDYMQGRVFLGEDAEPGREYVFGSIDRIGGVQFKTRAVRTPKYRYIKNFSNGLSILDNYNKLNEVEKTLVTPLPLEELYDLENDPFEVNNLAYKEGHKQTRQQLEAILMNWITAIDYKGFYSDSPEIEEHFIQYRTSNKEQYREERLKSYIEIEKQLKEEGKIR